MRIVAGLRLQGLSDEALVDEVVSQNLIQYPTLAMVGNIARTCLMRLDALGPAQSQLTELLAQGTSAEAVQANLYAMMRTYAVVWEFMTQVVGEHYRTLNNELARRDVNAFLARLQQGVPQVAAWSETTMAKTRQVLLNSLAKAGYLETARSTKLLPVLLEPALERAIRTNEDQAALAAFDYFWGCEL